MICFFDLCMIPKQSSKEMITNSPKNEANRGAPALSEKEESDVIP
jgi:hypothetical protein